MAERRLMTKRTLQQLDVHGKTVLVRVDFNIPIGPGAVDVARYDQRLRATLPTINYLLERDCRVVLCSHLGRPRGQADDALRLRPIAERLGVLLGRPALALPGCVGAETAAAIAGMEKGAVCLLENLRFHAGEEKNDAGFADELAALADCFVMDAFAVAHRAHASTVGVPQRLPSAMGLLTQREVESLGLAMAQPERPLAALLGGAKVSDKILMLENLLEGLDHLCIGGGMAVTFLAAKGRPVGASSVEDDRLDFAREVMTRAERNGVALHLPTDIVAASEFAAHPVESQTFAAGTVPNGWHIMDIGGATARAFAATLASCRTIIWNGPMGVFEMERFKAGTRIVAGAIAELPGAATVVGGGSTAEAVESLGLDGLMTHVSTGGGAALEFLGGKELPGLAALPDA